MDHSVHLLDLNVSIIIVIFVHIHITCGFVVGKNVQAVVGPVKPDSHRLVVQHTTGQQENRQWVQQLALNGTIERSSSIGRGVTDRHEILFALCIKVELDLPVCQPGLNLFQTDVNNLENVLV